MTDAGGTVRPMKSPAYPMRTSRLELRPYREDDLDFVLQVRSDPEMTRYLPFAPLTSTQEAREALEVKFRRDRLSAPDDVLQLVALRLGTDERIGEATLFWRSDIHRTGEVGYLVLPGARGQGYATELAAAMLRLAFEDFQWHRMVAHLDARNVESAAVCERLGMRREAYLVQNEWFKGEWTDEIDYAMLAREWPGSPAERLAAGEP